MQSGNERYQIYRSHTTETGALRPAQAVPALLRQEAVL